MIKSTKTAKEGFFLLLLFCKLHYESFMSQGYIGGASAAARELIEVC